MFLTSPPVPGIWEYLIQQAPVVVLLALVCYFGFSFFSKQMKMKDAIIKEKDEALEKLNVDYRSDLQSTSTVLQDVNGTLQKWVLKDEQNQDLNKSIFETLQHVKGVSDQILIKLSDK